MSTNYTVTLAGEGLTGQEQKQALILETARAAGLWLSTYISGTGSISVDLRFDPVIATMSASAIHSAASGQIKAQDGKAYTLYESGVAAEIRTGVDPNSVSPDAVINVGIANLDRYYWFDQTISTGNDIPVDKTDGFRVMLHELLHTVGFNGWLANTGASFTGPVISNFDSLVKFEGDRSFFVGDHARAAYGANVPLTNVHLGDAISFAEGRLTGAESLMSYSAPLNGIRISLDPVVIGMLRDLGHTVRDQQAVLSGDGKPGSMVAVQAKSDTYSIDRVLDLTFLSSIGKDTAVLIEDADRIKFTDTTIALDTGADMVGGQAYRIYQAAFDRMPDQVGLGFWIAQMDRGMALSTVAENFILADEFLKIYGSAPTHAAIVDKFYENVLNRAGDAGGIAYWNGLLDQGTLTVAQVLASFSESAENFTRLATVIGNGFEYTPYG